MICFAVLKMQFDIIFKKTLWMRKLYIIGNEYSEETNIFNKSLISIKFLVSL